MPLFRRLCALLSPAVLLAALVLGSAPAAAGPAASRPEPSRPTPDMAGCVAKTAGEFLARRGDAKADAAYGYDVQHVHLALDLSLDDSLYTGRVETLFVRTGSLPGDTLVLDCAGLQVDAVDRGGAPLAFVQRGDSLLVVVPAKAVGVVDSLAVTYRGAMQPGMLGLARNRWIRDPDDPSQTIWAAASMSEPEAARRWWPCKDTPRDKFTAQVDVTVLAGLTAVSNGVLEGTEDLGDGRVTWRWREDHPLPTYLVSVAVADYTLLAETCVTPASGPVPLRNWVFSPDTDDAQVDFAPLCDMLQFLESLAGPYPFADEKYGHAEWLNMRTGAMEHTTVTSYGSDLLTGDNYFDRIVVHELSHQWFGDSLTPATWADIWLNEGFATYSEALWREHLYGLDGDGVHGGYFQYIRALRWFDDFVGEGPVYDAFPVLSRIVYDKGAWILHMLRGRLGDAAFFDLLHAWATGGDRPGGNVTTEEFVQLAGQYAGEDLHPFFDPWLTTDAEPRLEITAAVTDGPAGPRSRLELRLRDRSGVAFDNVYPVRVATAAGEEWLSLRLVGQEAALTHDAGAAIDSVTVDPEQWVLWRETSAPPAPLQIVSVRPNPARRPPVTVAFRLEKDTRLRLRVFDALGHRLLERDLGTVPGRLSEQEVSWDGRDGAGRRAPSGVYWVQLAGGGYHSVKRLTLVR